MLMPISIISDNNLGRHRPAVYCDYCGNEIHKSVSGNCEWKVEFEGGQIIDSQPIFTHKYCCSSFEAKNSGKYYWKFMELTQFLDDLNM